jgi:curli production assembly/transport component CsgG
MNTMHRTRTLQLAWLLLLTLAGLAVSGCANYMEPFEVKPAHPGLESETKSSLTQLPPPQDKIVAAVYRFRDQTGQYKASERASTFSTAVTQGGTSILLRALEESGWFTTIEREGLSNLLNERQIIQSIRAQHQGPNGESLGSLPPLLYAGVMLEGGIVGYDTNVMTGGAGARFFGIGASGEFRQDQVTVYLRAVSTQSGRILKTVHTTKTILSQKVDGGAFLFVDKDRLLETEAGYTYNEPGVMAVTTAIEEAVKGLVVEGVRSGIWGLQNPADTLSGAFQSYDESVDDARNRDIFDRPVATNQRAGTSLGLSAGAQQYSGDYQNPQTRPMGGLRVRTALGERWGISLNASAGRLAARDAFDNLTAMAELQLDYYVLPCSPVSPYVQIGAGATAQSLSTLSPQNDVSPHVSGGAGLEIMAAPQLGIRAGVQTRYALDDGLDGADIGRVPDSVWGLHLGLTYYSLF